MKNLDELRSILQDTQSKTRSCVSTTRRLIDRSFLQLKESHRLLNAAERSKEMLAAMLRIDELSHQWSQEKLKSDAIDSQIPSICCGSERFIVLLWMSVEVIE
jgi:hypothetical protein